MSSSCLETGSTSSSSSRSDLTKTGSKFRKISCLETGSTSSSSSRSDLTKSFLRGTSRPLDQIHMTELFAASVSNRPNPRALIYNQQVTSLQDIDFLSTTLGHIVSRNVSPGSPKDGVFVLYFYPSDLAVISILAVWKLNGICVPMSPDMTSQQKRTILSESAPVCILTARKLSSTFDPPVKEAAVLQVDELLQPLPDPDDINTPLPTLRNLNNACSIVYISNRPVSIPHVSLINRIRWEAEQLPFTTEDVSCTTRKISQLEFIIESMVCILNGGSFLIPHSEQNYHSAIQQVNLIKTEKVTRLNLDPDTLASLLLCLDLSAAQRESLSLKSIICSRGLLPVVLAKKLSQCLPQVKFVYMFCTGTCAATYYLVCDNFHLPPAADRDYVALGFPIDNCIVKINCKRGHICEEGEPGELLLTDAIEIEKVQQKVKSNSKVDTGTSGIIIDGIVYFYTNENEKLMVFGEEEDTTRVEAAIKSSDGVNACLVSRQHYGANPMKLIAFYEPMVSVETVLRKASKVLPLALVPKLFPLKEIPRNPVNGRFEKQLLLKDYARALELMHPYELADLLHESARILFILESALDIPMAMIDLTKTFVEQGGNNSIAEDIVKELDIIDYGSSNEIFMSSCSLHEIISSIVQKMKLLPDSRSLLNITTFDNTIKSEDVTRILSDSFSKANLLFRTVGHPPHLLIQMLQNDWKDFVEQQLSLVAKNTEGKVLGVFVNMEFSCDSLPPCVSTTAIRELHHQLIEVPISRYLESSGARLLHTFAVAVDLSLTPQERTTIAYMMYRESLRIAKAKGFNGIISINSHITTQVMCSTYLNSFTIHCAKPKSFVFERNLPFESVPETFLIYAHCRPL